MITVIILIGILFIVSAYFIFLSKVYMLEDIQRLIILGEYASVIVAVAVCVLLFFGTTLTYSCWLFSALVVCGIVQKFAADRLYSNLILWLVDHPVGEFVVKTVDDDSCFGILTVDGQCMEATLIGATLGVGSRVPVGVYLPLGKYKYPDRIDVYLLEE